MISGQFARIPESVDDVTEITRPGYRGHVPRPAQVDLTDRVLLAPLCDVVQTGALPIHERILGARNGDLVYRKAEHVMVVRDLGSKMPVGALCQPSRMRAGHYELAMPFGLGPREVRALDTDWERIGLVALP